MSQLHQIQQPTVRQADAADAPFIRDLQIKLREALGWIGNSATEYRINAGHVNAVEENGEIAGFLLSSPRLANAPWIHPIFQAAIHYDLRRRHHGFALVRAEELTARAAACSMLSLWCAADLEANDFWRSAGFTSCGVRTGGRARRRTHILWRKPLTIDALPLLAIPNPRSTNGAGGQYRTGNTARKAANEPFFSAPFITEPFPINLHADAR